MKTQFFDLPIGSLFIAGNTMYSKVSDHEDGKDTIQAIAYWNGTSWTKNASNFTENMNPYAYVTAIEPPKVAA